MVSEPYVQGLCILKKLHKEELLSAEISGQKPISDFIMRIENCLRGSTTKKFFSSLTLPDYSLTMLLRLLP